VTKLPEHVLRDLGRKCADDVTGVIHRAAALTWADPQDCFFLALSAAASATGAVSGFAQRCMPDMTPEQAMDQVWSLLRPMMLASFGNCADLDKLLAAAPKSRRKGQSA
jgi:hypothetical protein